MGELTLHNLNEQLRVYVQETRQVKKLLHRRQALVLLVQQNEEVLPKMEARLDRDAASVEALENKSLRRFRANLRGKLEQQLEDEYESLGSLRRKVDEFHTQTSEARAEIEQIDHQLEHIGSVDIHYAELIALKEKLLLGEKTGPYVRHLEMTENLRQDQKEVRELQAFVQKLYLLLSTMWKNVWQGLKQEGKGSAILGQVLNLLLDDWKTLYKGLFHLQRELNGLQQRLEIELPRNPSFYPKLFDHFVEKQLSVPVPKRWARILTPGLNEYWKQRGQLADVCLDTYQDEINACIATLSKKDQQLDRLLIQAEQKRKRLLETL